MSPLAVAISPHLDDAVFSAGGALACLADAGWVVRVVTCFTASVADPGPFALSTQLDKGLDASVDYLALRRDEDTAACAVLGAQAVHLPLPEAPHRGYSSAAQLFAGVHNRDPAVTELRGVLAPVVAGADLVLAPQAIGNHADHLVTAGVVAELAPQLACRALWWRDVPYAVRHPDGAAPFPLLDRHSEIAVEISGVLHRKIAAARCYTTQLGFQFGGAQRAGTALQEWAQAEAARTAGGTAVETLSARPGVRWPL